MAEREHVEIAKHGAGAIARWRREHPDVQLDLAHADLGTANLTDANLRGAILRRANLRGAKLATANLRRADLRGAKLSRANFRRADLRRAKLGPFSFPNHKYIVTNLRGADLRNAHLDGVYLARADFRDAALRNAHLDGANLRIARLDGANLRNAHLNGASLDNAFLDGANLSDAHLERANLRIARLDGVDLTRTFFHETIFIKTNLTATQGLETCHHTGPSTLDHRTLLLSGGLPEIFLRGCGWPDELIAVVPALLQTPIQFYSCFISYSSQDEDFAKRLHADLQAANIRCWFAPEDMKIGDRLRVRIDESIRLYDKLLLILSEHSMASQWVEQEVETAMEREEKQGGTVLFPIRIDDAVMGSHAGWAHLIRRTRHIGDFTNWKDHDAFQGAFKRLLRDLRPEIQTRHRPKEQIHA